MDGRCCQICLEGWFRGEVLHGVHLKQVSARLQKGVQEAAWLWQGKLGVGAHRSRPEALYPAAPQNGWPCFLAESLQASHLPD